jgi:hypothetical protein
MDRKEYLQKMQSYREELQAESKKNRETLGKLANEHRDRVRIEADFYRKLVNEVQWAAEHPIQEVTIV